MPTQERTFKSDLTEVFVHAQFDETKAKKITELVQAFLSDIVTSDPDSQLVLDGLSTPWKPYIYTGFFERGPAIFIRRTIEEDDDPELTSTSETRILNCHLTEPLLLSRRDFEKSDLSAMSPADRDTLKALLVADHRSGKGAVLLCLHTLTHTHVPGQDY